MPEQEQQQPDGSDFKVDRDSFGTPESPYDSDGFVKGTDIEEAINADSRVVDVETDLTHAYKLLAKHGDHGCDIWRRC